jgi:hypothetical protein
MFPHLHIKNQKIKSEREMNRRHKKAIKKYPFKKGCKIEDAIEAELGWQEWSCIPYLEYCLKQEEDYHNDPEVSEHDKRDAIKRYESFTNNKHPMTFRLYGSPLEKMIDKATGYEEAKIKAVWDYSVYILTLYAMGLRNELDFDDDGNMVFENN